MSKTVETQIEKSRGLIQGLRKHLSQGGRGVTIQELDTMERALDVLVAANEECDRLRAELGPKVKHMNELLAGVKADYVGHKLVIKNSYPQERWMAYGLPDKVNGAHERSGASVQTADKSENVGKRGKAFEI